MTIERLIGFIQSYRTPRKHPAATIVKRIRQIKDEVAETKLRAKEQEEAEKLRLEQLKKKQEKAERKEAERKAKEVIENCSF